jgi:hypothetical protein
MKLRRRLIARSVMVTVAALLLAALAAAPLGAQDVDPLAISTSFDQCANGNPHTGDCDWIGSIIQESNSTYHEGMSVPQRAIFNNIETQPGNVHTLTFSHQTTKGGIHAYDFLTSWDQAEAAADDAGLSFSPSLSDQACDDAPAICANLHDGPSPYDCDSVAVPDDPFVSKDGATQAVIDDYETVYGNRVIWICSNQEITASSLSLVHNVANGGDTGDSYILYELEWTSTGGQLLVEMAGHISLSGLGDMAWGVGLGASNISGGPYHFRLGELDDAALGAQDNQIKGADILPPPPPPESGTITVDKVTDPPGETTSFPFELRDGADTLVAAFSLTDADSVFNSGAIDPGEYSVEEMVPAGWDLDDVICEVEQINGVAANAVANPKSITLEADEHWTCTFYDSQIPVQPRPSPTPPAEEFVPEWGSLGLLGGALVPLAGYGYALIRRRKK